MPITLDGTNGITTPMYNGTIAANAVVPVTGFKNRIINGGMAVDQRNSGAAQTITAASTLAYTVDRWYAYCTGANVTGQRVAGTGATQFRYRFTGAASVTKIGFVQRIEQLNSYDLSNSVVTLSVDLANSVLTTVTWVASYANTANTFGTLASPTVTQIATGTFTVNSTVTNYSTQITIPAAATTGLQIEFSVGAQTSGTWTIGNVQLEEGNNATSFDYRPYGTELALCQRYLPSTGTGTGITLGVGQAYSTTNGQAFIPFQVTPRTAPTGIVVNNVTHFTVLSAAGGNITTSNIVHQSAGLVGGNITWAVASGMTAGDATMFSTANTASLIYWTGCEL